MLHHQRKTGDIITLAQFEEGGLLSETRDDAESGDESDGDSIMLPPISEKEMNGMDSGDEYEYEPISTEMVEDINDGSQSHLNVNQRKARYKIHNRIRQT